MLRHKGVYTTVERGVPLAAGALPFLRLALPSQPPPEPSPECPLSSQELPPPPLEV